MGKKIFTIYAKKNVKMAVMLAILDMEMERFELFWQFPLMPHIYFQREHRGSVVECLTRDRRAAGSSLTSITAMCPWARA